MAKQMPELDDYKYGFKDAHQSVFQTAKGLSRDVVAAISEMKGEPAWMRDFRLKALEQFLAMPVPQWGGNLNDLDFDDIHYYVKPAERRGKPGRRFLPKSRRPSTSWGFPKRSKNTLRAFPRNTNPKWYTTA
ncbi:FeS cluster assembly protein SufB [Paenibacillus sp. P1XP2]|nr:FeS cluster assembly protein SufB [Paenibacillus sp. P1XP2]